MRQWRPEQLARELIKRRVHAADEQIAAVIKGDTTTVSRVFSEQYGVKLSRIGPLLDYLGLRVLDRAADVREVPEAEYQAMLVLVRLGQEALARGEVHGRVTPDDNEAR